ncbi:MAG: M20/M25/M40 family metallo-hydrolase, partial [Candidatus Rokuibacteriota bacterium]
IEDGGNVLRPSTSLKISLRLAPTTDGEAASRRLTTLFEADPPYGARVTFKAETHATGWNAPPMSAALLKSVHGASQQYFGQPAMFEGTGGTIPFMAMLGERFPKAEFVVTGVLGPGSNAHGPNEFLHVPTGVKVTACVAHILADRGRASA